MVFNFIYNLTFWWYLTNTLKWKGIEEGFTFSTNILYFTVTILLIKNVNNNNIFSILLKNLQYHYFIMFYFFSYYLNFYHSPLKILIIYTYCYFLNFSEGSLINILLYFACFFCFIFLTTILAIIVNIFILPII
jgi:hypothetical protein